MPSSLSARRSWFTQFLIFSIFLILIYQLVQLSLIRRPALLEIAERQQRINIQIPPLRGQILDRNGRELATNLKVPSIYVVPRLLKKSGKQELAASLATILKLDTAFVAARLSRDKSFVWLKRKVRFDEAAKVRKLETPVVGIVEEYRRFYPQGDLLAQILGFTDVDNQGLEGIELVQDHTMRGWPGIRQTKRDALGRELKAFEIKTIPSVDGHRVTLTIDQYLQYLTERALDRAYLKWKAKGAWAIIMEPATGKILAVANRPNFDPNAYEDSPAGTRRNRAVTDRYEPGSVFKIISASALLNENLVTPQTPFNCENGEYRYGSRVLHDVHPYGMLSFADVIVKSSNIGTVKAAALLKPDVFYRYIQLFGIAKPTGIDLPGEAAGFIRAPSQWSKTSPYNIPIGQEVQVTALQMVTALAVIANGGFLVQPYVIDRVEDQAGVLIDQKKPRIKHQVLRPEAAKIMRDILVEAVEGGTGKSARIEGVPVGGKTGTAQKILENARGYSHSRFMSSFVGFAPADDPKFVMIVVFDDPRPSYYGGTVAAPVFKEVMEAAFFTLGYVPQQITAAEKKAEMGKPVKVAPGNPPLFVPA